MQEICKKVQNRLGYQWPNITQAIWYCFALIVEVVELLQELPWKPWKLHLDYTLNKERILDEIADCYIFLGNIGLMLDVTQEEIDKAIEEKANRVINRENYGNQTKGE